MTDTTLAIPRLQKAWLLFPRGHLSGPQCFRAHWEGLLWKRELEIERHGYLFSFVV